MMFDLLTHILLGKFWNRLTKSFQRYHVLKISFFLGDRNSFVRISIKSTNFCLKFKIEEGRIFDKFAPSPNLVQPVSFTFMNCILESKNNDYRVQNWILLIQNFRRPNMITTQWKPNYDFYISQIKTLKSCKSQKIHSDILFC